MISKFPRNRRKELLFVFTAGCFIGWLVGLPVKKMPNSVGSYTTVLPTISIISVASRHLL